ncbi:hypothetical protein TNCV_3356222 [Trichonephila clavipes]|nr:hypothetical protein TNCV_3356222 [Trichonephila clavipes]
MRNATAGFHNPECKKRPPPPQEGGESARLETLERKIVLPLPSQITFCGMEMNYGFDSWCCYCPVATLAQWSRYQTHGRRVMSLTPGPPNTCHAEWADARFICRCSNVLPLVWCEIRLERGCQLKCRPRHLTVVRNYEIVRVHYFVRGGFVGHRSRASSKHLSPHLPVGSLDSSGGSNRGCAASEAARVGVESTKKPTPDVVVFET